MAMKGWNHEMDENTQAKFAEKIKELLNMAKRKECAGVSGNQ